MAELEKAESSDRIFEKQLHFAISLTGPFFTMYAFDMTTLVERDVKIMEGVPNRDRNYRQIHRTIISPYGEFSAVYEQIRKLIEKEFNNYLFVPYFIK